MNATQRRRTQNETMSRIANEAIEEQESPGEGSTAAFLCECTRPDCERLIELTPQEYRRVRANPRRFIVRPGHESSDLEEVIEARSAYVIVEKLGEAGAMAEAEDPPA
jgi:hypothetical protein